ncbi:M48 family metalloprotease [Zooshikella harenae]|uniref:Putative beta-barrel assembly-enhancing protease n=1 Tax=Zooshikella harenae TaxID=2827238 RepID=A0ABS5ZAG1_9GAMM|nr:M48 family metalloprotease [Zooshikella harenae]MBU2710311.1 M48 family metallopeptidase [Zooshikella harenae]
MFKKFCTTICTCSLALSLTASGNELLLPDLGDSSSAIVSPSHEHKLGRAFLASLRGQVPMLQDAEVQDYVEELIFKLINTSEVKDRRLEIIVIDSPKLNAFAAPGGIIGINAGLFLYAKNEHQFASVIAHELAHLSQRHYARGVENAERNKLPYIAATLASIAVLAAGGGDAGFAALATTQAGMRSQMLSFSRQNEREADNVGIQNLYRAGMNPQAMPAMFEQMNRATRFLGQKPPEFLLTHPVTQNRIADSKSRATQFPKQNYTYNSRYGLIKAKIKLHYASTPQTAAKQFKANAKQTVARYGLSLAQTASSQLKQAQSTLKPLYEKSPDNIQFALAQARLEKAMGNISQANKTVTTLLDIYPKNHALMLQLAENQMAGKQYAKAEQTLRRLSRNRATDPYVWYLLAEARGLNKNILGVHEARAEYYRLNGNVDKAIEHLEYALKLAKGKFAITAKLNKQIEDLRAYKKELKDLGFG